MCRLQLGHSFLALSLPALNSLQLPRFLPPRVRSPSVAVLVANAVQSSEFLSPTQQEALVAALLKSGSGAAAAAAARHAQQQRQQAAQQAAQRQVSAAVT